MSRPPNRETLKSLQDTIVWAAKTYKATEEGEILLSIEAEAFGRPAANTPTVVDQDNLTLYRFTVNTDFMTYKLPVPWELVTGEDIQINAVWTNDGGVDDNGKEVKVRIDYQTAAEGDAVSGSHANSPKTQNDTYTSASGWIEHHTGFMTIANADFTGKECIYIKISFITPDGVALTCEPHLIGICLKYVAHKVKTT